MSEIKCDSCKVKPCTEPCNSCPYKPALMARMQERMQEAIECDKMAKSSYVVTDEEERMHNMDRTKGD